MTSPTPPRALMERTQLRRLAASSVVVMTSALAGCFNPAPLTSESSSATTDEPTTTDAPATATSSDPGPTTSTSTPTSTTSDTTTSSIDCDCPASAPYCLPGTSTCVDCNAFGDAGCVDLDPATPKCLAGPGLCVACLDASDCPGTACDADQHVCVACVDATDCPDQAKPACDANTHACRKCNTHTDCPQSACDLFTGACFDPFTTLNLYVEKNNSECKTMGACQQEIPCCEIADAISLAQAQPLQGVLVLVSEGAYTAPFRVTIPGHKIAVLVDDPGKVSLTVGDATKPAIAIGQIASTPHVGSTLSISGVAISGTTTHAALCDNADGLWLDSVAIYDHMSGPAAETRSCPLTIVGSHLKGNKVGVVAGALGNASLINVVVQDSTEGPNLHAASDARLDVLYTTVADRSEQPNRLLTCDLGANVRIRNSILFATPAMPANPACKGTLIASHTAFTAEGLVVDAPTNEAVAAILVPTLFNDWDDGDINVFGDGGLLKGRAEWHAGDPATDINGALRPTVDPSPDVAGADLPGP